MSDVVTPHGGVLVDGVVSPAATQDEAPRTPGAILWFTGLSGAGKSTLALAVRDALAQAWRVEILDGDQIRTHLSKGLGFSREDRDTNVRRIGLVARLLARNGVFAITAAISPYRDVRDEVRALAARDGVPFVEVFADAEIEALAERDVKGLYRKALAGELAHFTGVSDPYEPPLSPDVVIRSDRETVDESRDRILAALAARGLLTPRVCGGRRMTDRESLFPVFLRLAGRRVLVVGGGPVASSKLAALVGAGALVHVVAPEVVPEIVALGVPISRREFAPSDLGDVWFVVAAATPEVNRQVADAAESRHLFVNAVDDLASASAYLGGRRAQRRCDAGDFHRRPCTCAGRAAARGPGGRAAGGPRDVARDRAGCSPRLAARRGADAGAPALAVAGDQPPVRASPAGRRGAGLMSRRDRTRVAGRRRARGSGPVDASRRGASAPGGSRVVRRAGARRRSSRSRGARNGSRWASAAAGRRSGRRRFTAS